MKIMVAGFRIGLMLAVLAPGPVLAGDWDVLATGAVGVATPAAQAPDFYEDWWPQAENRAVGTLGVTVRRNYGHHFIGVGAAGRLENSTVDFHEDLEKVPVRGVELPEHKNAPWTTSGSLQQRGLGQLDLHVGVKAGQYSIILGGGAVLDRYEMQAISDRRGSVITKSSTYVPGPPFPTYVDDRIWVGGGDARTAATLDTLRVSPMLFTAIERQLTDRIAVSLRGQVSLQSGTISGSSSGSYHVDEFAIEDGALVPDGSSTQTYRDSVSADLQPQGSLMLGLSFRLN